MWNRSSRERRTPVLLVALLLSNIAVAPSAPAIAQEKPNIAFIHSDDHGWADVGFRGSVIDTPNIDAIAAAGVTIDRYHAYPICGPTRVGLMTGRNPIRTGLTGNISEGEDGVPLDEHMLPQTFKAAGYQTWALGKWHLGGTTGAEYLPQNRGFDHFYGFIGGSINETTHETPGTGTLDWQRNGAAVPEDDGLLSTDLLATEAISLIENRDPTKPFLLYLAFHAVHTPYNAPQALKDKYTALGFTGQQMEYSAMVENMDLNIGRVLDALASEGIDRNTLVVFASDNGADVGKGGSNAPLRGWKGEVFEGGHRTPAAIRWPDVLPSGVASVQYVSHMDWLPTLASAAGIAPQNSKPLDGRDRWQAIRNGESGRPHAQVIRRGQGVAALDGDWKLVRETNAGPYQLYDVYVDPNETTDLAALYPSVVTELAAYIDLIESGNDDDGDWVADSQDECTTLLHRTVPASPPDQNPAKFRLGLKNLDEALGAQSLTAKGYFNPSSGVPAIDPSLNGVHVRISDANGEIYDVNIPGGIVGSSPCDPADGWRVTISATARKWNYQNRSGGLPDGMGGCTAGAAKGVTRLLVSDLTASSKAAFFFKVTARDAPFSVAPASPVERLQISVALAAEATPGVAPAQAVAGQCAEFALEGNPLPSAAPKPYCKTSPSSGPLSTIRCVGA